MKALIGFWERAFYDLSGHILKPWMCTNLVENRQCRRITFIQFMRSLNLGFASCVCHGWLPHCPNSVNRISENLQQFFLFNDWKL